MDDLDVVRVARLIGVGEDEVRAVIEVETAGGGFDQQGRPRMLFEPHVFWRELGTSRREQAVSQGLAYRKWGEKPYPADSYPRLERAMKIDAAAALRSASWGLGQIMGFNHKAAGYASPGDMVVAFCEDEALGLEAMVRFIESECLDDDLRRHDWSGFARGYNGAGYAQHGYHLKLSAAYARWRLVPDAEPALPPTVGPGSRGEVVLRAQTLLQARGFDPVWLDGIFGDGTRTATVFFQESAGLKADGIIGPRTWARLVEKEQTA